jgi:hypothetical protein
LKALPLCIDNLLFPEEETELHEQNMVHTILRIIVHHREEGLKKWQKDLDTIQPRSSETSIVHKSVIHPVEE